MSEQLVEPGIDRTLSTLTELETIEPRTTDPEALFLNERGMGGVAVLRVMGTEATPEEALLDAFDATVNQSRRVPGNRDAIYLGPQWVDYTRNTLLPSLVKGRRLTINNGGTMVTGRLNDRPTVTANERSPLLINIAMTVERTGEQYKAAVTPGQIEDLTVQEFPKEDQKTDQRAA